MVLAKSMPVAAADSDVKCSAALRGNEEQAAAANDQKLNVTTIFITMGCLLFIRNQINDAERRHRHLNGTGQRSGPGL